MSSKERNKKITGAKFMVKTDLQFNTIIVFLLAGALFGLYWLQRLGISAGDAYLWLFVIGLVFVLVAIVAKLGAKINFWFEIPIDKNNERAILMLFFGCVCMLILSAASLFGGNFWNPFTMAPLAQFGNIGFGGNTFAALSAVTSPFWTFFIIVISAAVIEEIVLGFAFVSIGSLLSYSLRKLLALDFGGGDKESGGNYLWDFAGAMLFSVILFAILHYFNSTYVDPNTGKMIWSMFLWAASFRFILNVFIYKFGNFGVAWSIGVHAVNNAVFLGGATVAAALTTFPGGIILDVLLILFLFYAFLKIKEVIKEGKNVGADFFSFD
jgi:membrane protease YdiL (CAAX protease family)